MYNLKDRIAIVTGAGSGIGRMVAIQLGNEGAKVVLNGRNRQKLESVASEISGDLLVVPGDVGSREDVKRMVSETLRNFGHIDILVNSAGICRLDAVVDTTEEMWDEVFRTNTKGVFLCCKEVAPHMIKQNSGKIVNIASTAGKRPSFFNAAYSASKSAMIMFTQTLALELARHKVNVNAVCPGVVDETEMRPYVDGRYAELGTEMRWTTPLGRISKPLDIANAVLFLASDQSEMITGQSINVNGGVYFV